MDHKNVYDVLHLLCVVRVSKNIREVFKVWYADRHVWKCVLPYMTPPVTLPLTEDGRWEFKGSNFTSITSSPNDEIIMTDKRTSTIRVLSDCFKEVLSYKMDCVIGKVAYVRKGMVVMDSTVPFELSLYKIDTKAQAGSKVRVIHTISDNKFGCVNNVNSYKGVIYISATHGLWVYQAFDLIEITTGKKSIELIECMKVCNGECYGAALDSNGNLYVLSSQVLIFDSDLKYVTSWAVRPYRERYTSIAIYKDIIFLISHDGYLHCYDANECQGQCLCRITVPNTCSIHITTTGRLMMVRGESMTLFK
jgi:hypothetical protein